MSLWFVMQMKAKKKRRICAALSCHPFPRSRFWVFVFFRKVKAGVACSQLYLFYGIVVQTLAVFEYIYVPVLVSALTTRLPTFNSIYAHVGFGEDKSLSAIQRSQIERFSRFRPTWYFAVASVIFVMLQLVIWAQLHSHKSDHWKLCLLSQACAQTVFLSLLTPLHLLSAHCSFLWLAWELQPSLYALQQRTDLDFIIIYIYIYMYKCICIYKQYILQI